MKCIAVAAGLAISLFAASNASAATLLFSSIPDLTATPSGSVTTSTGAFHGAFTISGAADYVQITSVQFVMQQSPDAPAGAPFAFMRWGMSNVGPVHTCCLNSFFYPAAPDVSWIQLASGDYLVTIDIGLLRERIGLAGPPLTLTNGDYTFDLSGLPGSQTISIPTYSGGTALTLQNGSTFTPVSGSAAFALYGAVDPVPEPATWAMLIAGFGLIGFSLRRRATRLSVA